MKEDQRRLSEQLTLLEAIQYSDLGQPYRDAGIHSNQAERDPETHHDVRLLDTIALLLATGEPGDVFAAAFDRRSKPVELVLAKNGLPTSRDIAAADKLLSLIASPTIPVRAFFRFLLDRCGTNVNKRIASLHQSIQDNKLRADFALKLEQYHSEPNIALEFPVTNGLLAQFHQDSFAKVWSNLIEDMTDVSAEALDAQDEVQSSRVYNRILLHANVLVRSRFFNDILNNPGNPKCKWRVERLKRRLDKMLQYSNGVKQLIKKREGLFPISHRWVLTNFTETGESVFRLSSNVHLAISHGLQCPLSTETKNELNANFPDMITDWEKNRTRRVHTHLHAELRIILYLGQPRTGEPLVWAIGVSKRSCLCCALWIYLHNEEFETKWMTSGSHGKPYPNWALPGTACAYAKQPDGRSSVDKTLLAGVSMRLKDALNKLSPGQNRVSDEFTSGGESSDGAYSDASLTESHEQHASRTETSTQPEDSTSTVPTSVSGTASVWSAPVTEVNSAPHLPKQPSKSPATSKLSWANVARPHKKQATSAPPQTTPVPPPVTAPSCLPPSVPDALTERKERKVKAKAPPPPILAQHTPISAPQAGVTPSPKLFRPVRSARHRVTNQPVTMPVYIGSGIKKAGMQFGSLSLAGDGSVTVQSEPEVPAAPPAAATPPPPPPQVKSQPEPVAPAAPPLSTAPASSTSLTSVFQQQQQQQSHSPLSQPQAQQALSPPTTAPYHTIPTSISQPIQSSQTSHAAVATSPLQQYARQQQAASQQQLLANNTHQPQTQPQQRHQPPHLQQQRSQHLQHLPQQVQQNQGTHHSYTQHGLPTHIDPAQPTQTAAQQQPLQSATHSNYFHRGVVASSAPYFHTPTPPATQAQDSSYGSFGQLGGQGQHQQGSHLGSFGSSDYGYAENSRGFYDTYQQPGFGDRSHEDVEGLPGSQQPAATSLLSAQGPQYSSQGSNQQPQPSSGQGPQQSYPPPLVPYYYPHATYSQSQYYGAPYNSGYVPQGFVKYPTMFQPGPQGPGSAANPAVTQPAGNVGVGIQQANPYGQGLYQPGGYDEYQPHPHHSQYQHRHSLRLSQGAVGSGDYTKQLYGGGAQGGMQGFMGLGQSGTSAGPASNTGPRNATSPDAPYKPYASKDVLTGRSAPGAQGNQGQGPPQGQGQGSAGQGGPQGQSFYGENRFGTGVSDAGSGGVGVGGAPQQGGHHQQGGPHLGYPQGWQ